MSDPIRSFLSHDVAAGHINGSQEAATRGSSLNTPRKGREVCFDPTRGQRLVLGDLLTVDKDADGQLGAVLDSEIRT
jgi:hypothetical protein